MMLYIIAVIVIVLAVAAWLFLVDADLTTFALNKVSSGSFNNKVVWITGASSGIGASLAEALTLRGAQVILSARRKEELEKVATKCKGPHPPLVYPLDVLNFENHTAATKELIDRFGRIDICVLNAGRSQRATALDTDLEVTRQMIELNVFAPISMAKAIVPYMLAQKSGQVVITSSVAAKLNTSLISSYALSKAGLCAYFESLRCEVASHGVTVCSVLPGPVHSEIITQAFTNKIGGATKYDASTEQERKMSSERCAELMCTALYWRVSECWLSQHPVLGFVYIASFLPGLFRYLNAKIAPLRIQAFKQGRDGNDLFQLGKAQKQS